jgi:hypothetical protein
VTCWKQIHMCSIGTRIGPVTFRKQIHMCSVRTGIGSVTCRKQIHVCSIGTRIGSGLGHQLARFLLVLLSPCSQKYRIVQWNMGITEPQGTVFFSVAGRLRLLQVLGFNGPRDSKFSTEDRFRCTFISSRLTVSAAFQFFHCVPVYTLEVVTSSQNEITKRHAVAILL